MRKKLSRAVQWFNQKGIARRITLVYSLVIALLVTIFGGYLLVQQNAAIRSSTQAYADSYLETLLGNIDASIDAMRRTALILLSDKGLMSFLTTEQELTAGMLLENKENIRSIEQYREVNPKLSAIRVYIANPYVDEILPSIQRVDRLSGQPWFDAFAASTRQNLLRLGPGDTASRQTGGETHAYFYSKMEYRFRTVPGVIEVSMALDDFLLYQETELPNLKPQLFFLSADGIVPHGTADDTSAMAWLADGLATGQPQKSPKDNRYVYAYQHIAQLDAWLVVWIDISGVLAAEVPFRLLLVGFIVLSIIVLYVIISLITSKMLRKIVQLQDIMQSGSLTFEVKSFGNDEIGNLAMHFHDMLENIQQLGERNTRVLLDLKSAEIQALQAQINSHFLYNTLESIGMLAGMNGDSEAKEALGLMGKIMRYDLDWKSTVVLLHSELSHIRNYMGLMKIRQAAHGAKISLYANISDDLLKVRVPKMILQPIVENAIQYGAAGVPGREEIEITVAAYRDEHDRVVIDVIDNGKGIAPELLSHLQTLLRADPLEAGDALPPTGKSGIGLININQRIKLFYGAEYGVRIDSALDVYTKVSVVVPYRAGDTLRGLEGTP